MIPAMTADDQAEHDYRQWVESWLYHLDQIPRLLETTSLLALPTVRASRTDQVKITGGGYIDNVPITDGGASTDGNLLWATLCAYLHAVSTHTDSVPPLAQHPRLWRLPAGEAPTEARAHAIEATGWLADLVDHVIDWPDLAYLEDELFALVRRLKGRYRSAGTVRRARPRICGVCGECAVLIDWVDGANGSPKPVQVGVCKVCGQTYTEGENG